MLSNKTRMAAERTGELVAAHYFATVLNSRFRGPNLTWDNLETLVAEMAAAQAHTPFSDGIWQRHKAEIEQVTVNTARHTIRQLIDKSGVSEWLYR